MLTVSTPCCLRRYGEGVPAATPYHHGNLGQALVDAAVDAVREQGPGGWSLRDLCRRVGVSHNAAYRHFAHRDDLVAVVSAATMTRLVETLEERLARVEADDPVLRARRRLAEAGRGYVDFAVGDPHLFRLAFASAVVRDPAPAPGRDPYGVLSRVLDDLVAVGFLAPSARPGAETTCWSAVHGFACLCIEGPLRDAAEAARAAELDHVLVAIDRSYAATTGAAVGPDDLRAARPG
ncbi:TetR family transcriptional regulator [Nocardioides sp. zg-578]|nr:TetR family transcriptional regulator [Nocardioides marmotae]